MSRKKPDLNEVVAWAIEKSKQTQKLPSWKPDDGTDSRVWGTIVGHHRDSKLLEESNWAVITQDMRKRFPDDTEPVRFRHFAVGWVEEFFVRLWDAQGQLTPAAIAGFEWADALEQYPVADEMHYSEMEYEATLENIESEGKRLLNDKAPKDWAQYVYRWLSDNNPSAVEDRDDGGGYPSEDELADALRELGWLDEEDED